MGTFSGRVLFFIFSSFLLIPHSALADGMLYSGRALLRPLRPGEQAAAIVHRENIEKMVIALNFQSEEQDRAVWIFPVPGTPEAVKVDVVDSFPRFNGRDPRHDASLMGTSLMLLTRATLGWPLAVDVVMAVATPNLLRGRPPRVHNEVEKWGIHAETITSESVEDLAEYLQEKEAGISVEQLRPFAPYFSDQYVLVVAWLASEHDLAASFPDYQQYRSLGIGRQPALYVEFPTETAFYPMRPTSSYGEGSLRIRLFVADYVQLHAPGLLAGSFHTAFLDQPRLPANAPEVWLADLEAPFRYSAITIDAPARTFTGDLRFSLAKEPGSIARAHGFLSMGVALLPVLIAVLSYLAAGTAGIAVRCQWRGYAELGLWNLLTYLALRRAVRRLPGEPAGEWKKRFLRWFRYTFIALTLAVQFAFVASFGDEGTGDAAVAWFFSVFIYGGLFLLFIFFWLLSRLAPKETAQSSRTGE